MATDAFVRVRGADENNLRHVDVDVPRDAVVVFTGVSGSGKSSLAFGTIYAEAQRRYLESVAPYARRLFAQATNPKVESITGLPPAVALQQRRGAPSSRSSVGTVTTLSNSLRMLFSRTGTYPEAAPRLDSDSFSPNTVAGACPQCHGLGVAHTVTEDSLVPDPSLTIRQGAIAAWPGAWQAKNLRDVLTVLGHDVDVPWRKLPHADRDWILFTDEQPVVQVNPQRDRVAKPYQGRFWSARAHVLHTLADSPSEAQRKRVLQFMISSTCPTCGGAGLTPAALAVTVAGRSIAELNALPLTGLVKVLQAPTTSEVAATITDDLLRRLAVLVELGLGYLALGRTTTTLSPGEMQRLRIATQLRSGLFGVVYVLDEPSAGLHPADAEPLQEVLAALVTSGNSVFIVEHDMDTARAADWLVDVGPRAGEGGGRVLYGGPPAGLADVADSITREFLHPVRPVTARAPRVPSGWLRLRGVRRHNLDGLDVDLPLGVLTAVTGVSGSGKSTLVSQVLPEILRNRSTEGEPDGETDGEPGGEPGGETDGAATEVGQVRGAEAVDRLVRVDQKPIGRTPRSTLATYTGLFDAVRKAFAGTDLARARGWGAGRFSFNVAGGRCETCAGEGFVAVELLFLPGSYGPCPVCHGARFTRETLQVTWNGLDVGQVLGLTVDAAAEALAGLPAAARSLDALQQVGLGYLRLGQPATELSGGEGQRIKLATELQRVPRGHTLYVLDEPTTGLHPADVRLLLAQLHRLVDTGSTVVVVEHDMDVVAAADHVVDMGPAGGDAGGRVVVAGTPAEVAAHPDSRTAPFLAKRLPHAWAP